MWCRCVLTQRVAAGASGGGRDAITAASPSIAPSHREGFDLVSALLRFLSVCALPGTGSGSGTLSCFVSLAVRQSGFNSAETSGGSIWSGGKSCRRRTGRGGGGRPVCLSGYPSVCLYPPSPAPPGPLRPERLVLPGLQPRMRR